MQAVVIALLVCLLAVPLMSLVGTMAIFSSLPVADLEPAELARVDQCGDQAGEAASGSVDLCRDAHFAWLQGVSRMPDKPWAWR